MQNKLFFGITDSGCKPSEKSEDGKQADCHCGDVLPTDKYEEGTCNLCNDKDGQQYHCGKCGWKLDVYKIHSKIFLLLELDQYCKCN